MNIRFLMAGILDPTYEHKIENMYEYKPEKDMTVYAKWADAYKLIL